MEPGIVPYLSNQAYCGICMKTTADALLVPNTHDDFFVAVQISPPPLWLCVWCRARLRGFTMLRDKARRAQYLLNVIKGLLLDSFLESGKNVETEINLLKRSSLVTKLVSVTNLASLEPDYVKVKTEAPETMKRGRRRMKQDTAETEAFETETVVTEQVEIKVDPAIDDDDSWTAVPLKLLKEEDEKSFTSTLAADNVISDDSYLEPPSTFTEEQLEAKSNKQSTKKSIIKKPANTSERELQIDTEQTELTEPQIIDINTAIDDLDNESYIVSEEVHQHVETIVLSEAGDKQRAFRLKKPSYVQAAYRCEACALGYAARAEYDAHMHNHSPLAGSHRCHPCDMYFEKHRELRKHHMQSHDRRHRCRLCSHGSTDYRAAVKHYISQHSRVSFTCWLCNKEFRRPINLKKHMQKEHDREQRTGCAVCGEEFPDAKLLAQHMQSHKPEEIAWHECPICKKKSRNKYNMTQHIKAHDKETLPIVCDICHKTFKTNVLLTTHVQRLHTENSKKYECHDCGKGFYNKSELTSHTVRVHLKIYSFQCTTCTEKFVAKRQLKEHILRKHHKIQAAKDKMCDVCGKGFSTLVMLRNHRLIHTGERPHSCPQCGRTFRHRVAMTTHVKLVHMGIKYKDLLASRKKRKKVCFEEK